MERQDEIQVRQSAGGENERWLDDDRRVPPSRKYRLRKLTFSKTLSACLLSLHPFVSLTLTSFRTVWCRNCSVSGYNYQLHLNDWYAKA